MRLVTTPVDAVGNRQVAGAGLFVDRRVHHLVDVGVALVGDDALGVVVHLLLAVHDMGLDVVQKRLVQMQFLLHLLIPLETA